MQCNNLLCLFLTLTQSMAIGVDGCRCVMVVVHYSCQGNRLRVPGDGTVIMALRGIVRMKRTNDRAVRSGVQKTIIMNVEFVKQTKSLNEGFVPECAFDP